MTASNIKSLYTKKSIKNIKRQKGTARYGSAWKNGTI